MALNKIYSWKISKVLHKARHQGRLFKRSLDSSSIVFFAKLGKPDVRSLRSSSDGGVRLFSHSFMMADAVRLMLLGVKLFKAGHAASSHFEVEFIATVECRPVNSLDGLVTQVSKYNAARSSFIVEV